MMPSYSYRKESFIVFLEYNVDEDNDQSSGIIFILWIAHCSLAEARDWTGLLFLSREVCSVLSS